MFAWFWSAVLFVLPIVHYQFISDFRLQKNIFFLFVGFLSLILFKSSNSKLISFVSAAFFTKTIFSKYILASAYTIVGAPIAIRGKGAITGRAFLQTIEIFLGLALINQFSAHWDGHTKKYLSNERTYLIQRNRDISAGVELLYPRPEKSCFYTIPLGSEY